jgi:hypothetical protein
MSESKTVLLSSINMNARFFDVLPPDKIMEEEKFFAYLKSYSGTSVDELDLIRIVSAALRLRKTPAGNELTVETINRIIDCMVGDKGRAVGNKAKETFVHLARIRAISEKL